MGTVSLVHTQILAGRSKCDAPRENTLQTGKQVYACLTPSPQEWEPIVYQTDIFDSVVSARHWAPSPSSPFTPSSRTQLGPKTQASALSLSALTSPIVC